uniref:Uncharacterized protein n=1 Tax=Anguilla anguilla TaxID=7936 RepID=A0A0E9UR77_ANGAN
MFEPQNIMYIVVIFNYLCSRCFPKIWSAWMLYDIQNCKSISDAAHLIVDKMQYSLRFHHETP